MPRGRFVNRPYEALQMGDYLLASSIATATLVVEADGGLTQIIVFDDVRYLIVICLAIYFSFKGIGIDLNLSRSVGYDDVGEHDFFVVLASGTMYIIAIYIDPEGALSLVLTRFHVCHDLFVSGAPLIC